MQIGWQENIENKHFLLYLGCNFIYCSPRFSETSWKDEAPVLFMLFVKSVKHQLGWNTHHVGADGLRHHAADRRFEGCGGREQGARGEQRWRSGRWWKRRGGRGQNGHDWAEHWEQWGGLRAIPRSQPGDGGLGRRRLGLWIRNHLADDTDKTNTSQHK